MSYLLKKKLLYHQLHIHANDPNPFNRQTRIEYGLPQADHVRLTIYDVLSRALTLLVNERKEAGLHAVVWLAQEAARGLYFYRLQVGSHVETRTMLLLR